MYQHVRVAVKMKPKAFGMYDSIYAEIQKLQYDSNAVYINVEASPNVRGGLLRNTVVSMIQRQMPYLRPYHTARQWA
ncbi:hypothetical protein BC936DRAFT_149091 [Jimgerdemannia flammicorona]|uniref:Uncharacterized protein n=1 Tax=Jimgerdemannia flammicorona TaxID=994334 RepID=A0A433D1L3_9FUNG|nr:hypothetical protein BC936DRAFT_149091 [Jimgerdemannia flammicorona]